MLEGIASDPSQVGHRQHWNGERKNGVLSGPNLGRPYQGMAGFFQEAARGRSSPISLSSERVDQFPGGKTLRMDSRIRGGHSLLPLQRGTPETYKGKTHDGNRSKYLVEKRCGLRHRLFLLPMQHARIHARSTRGSTDH